MIFITYLLRIIFNMSKATSGVVWMVCRMPRRPLGGPLISKDQDAEDKGRACVRTSTNAHMKKTMGRSHNKNPEMSLYSHLQAEYIVVLNRSMSVPVFDSY